MRRALLLCLAVVGALASAAPWPSAAQQQPAPPVPAPLNLKFGSGLNTRDGETTASAFRKTQDAFNALNAFAQAAVSNPRFIGNVTADSVTADASASTVTPSATALANTLARQLLPLGSLGICRSEIPSKVILLKAVTVACYASAGDGGAARYVPGTAGDAFALQDAAGNWFKLDLSDSLIRGEAIGVVAGSTSAAGVNATAINAGFAALGARGGGELRLPPGNVYVGATLDNRFDYVTLSGSGRLSAVYGTPVYPTTIVPTFAGTVVRHRSVTPGDHVVQGGGLVNFRVIGNGVALRNVEINTVWGGTYRFWSEQAVGFEGVYIYGGTTSPGAGGLQKVDMDITSAQYGPGPEANANAVVFDGDLGNPSINAVMRFDVSHQNGHGLVLGNSDNNMIWLRAFRVPGGTGRSVLSKAAATEPASARANIFTFLSANSAPIVQGTETAASPSTMLIQYADQDNGTPLPEIGTGAKAPVLNVTGQYTPTVTSATGSPGAGAVASGQWVQDANGLITAFVNLLIPNGSAASGALIVSLPRPMRNGAIEGSVVGKELSVTGKSVVGATSGSSATFQFYDGVFQGQNGMNFRLKIQYLN